ncbi:MAG: DUF2029 domain-containing protein [Planctomycetia bacterium]|nr:DUF2029 domain-containing protein [Planctomycetia bacterium]
MTDPGWLRRWLPVAALVPLLLVLASMLPRLLGDAPALPIEDFVEYWAAGRLHLQGGDPYAIEQLLPLQHQAGRTDLVYPIQMFNPPWTLPLVVPFGLLPARPAHLLWLCLQLAAVVWSADRLWLLFGGAPEQRFVAWLIALGFAPTLITLRMGQISGWLLFSVAAFLVCQRRGQDFLSGAALSLASIKPHLLWLVAVAVLVWAVRERRWPVLRGGLGALAAATGAALACNSDVWRQYGDMLREHPPKASLSPTIGGWLRDYLGADLFWLQFLPLALGLAWFAWHWMRQREVWDWTEQLPLLLLVSCLTASYGGWPFDLVVLLVPVIQVAVWAVQAPSLRFRMACLLTFLVVTTGQLAIRGMEYHIWVTPVLLLAYLACAHAARTSGDAAPRFS